MKLTHYAAKTINASLGGDLESAFTGAFVGFLLGVFAYMGYIAKIPALLFLCAFGSAICFLVSFYELYALAKEKLRARRSSKSEET